MKVKIMKSNLKIKTQNSIFQILQLKNIKIEIHYNPINYWLKKHKNYKIHLNLLILKKKEIKSLLIE